MQQQPTSVLYDLKPEHLDQLARLLDHSPAEGAAAAAAELRSASRLLTEGTDADVLALATLLHDTSHALVEHGDAVLALLCRVFFETLAWRAGGI